MKRSAALAPLSREHHHALVVARALGRCQAGGEQAAAEQFVEFLRVHELGHFAVEEAELLPLLRDDPEAHTLADRVRSDHEYLRDALRTLEGGAAPDLATLHAIGDRLRRHVRMEEQQLFPYVERVLAPEVLEALGARLSK